MMGVLQEMASEHERPLVFATISGAHLYGFPSPDSDVDLRGVHVLALDEVIGLGPRRETIERSVVRGGLEIDLVTHDIEKVARLLLRRNGYVLEQLLSPLVVATSTFHEELCALAPQLVTRNHAHHYLGFFETQWRLFQKARRVKALLYTYRVLLTGIHLMRTGAIEANLPRLAADAKLRFIDELIAVKTQGAEKGELADAVTAFHERECQRLVAALRAASESSTLPESSAALSALNDILIRIRKAHP